MVLSYCAMSQPSPSSTLFSYTTLFRSQVHVGPAGDHLHAGVPGIRLLQTLGEDPRALEGARSEEHTSELQSRGQLVCRLLLEKKKKNLSKSHRGRPRTFPAILDKVRRG